MALWQNHRVRRSGMEQRVPANKVKGLLEGPSRARTITDDNYEPTAPKGLNPIVGFFGIILALAAVGGILYGLILFTRIQRQKRKFSHFSEFS